MNKILVCTDFSDSSNMALEAAETLRIRSNGSIHLLHVSEFGFELNDIIPESETYRDTVLHRFKKSIEEKLANQIQSCNVTATALVKDGNLVKVIQELSADGQYDLIVMGHGRGPIMSQLIGSNAYKMISSTPVPLLLVKGPMNVGKIAGLIDESDLKDKTIKATFDFFMKFSFQNIGFISLWMDFPEPFGNQHNNLEIRENILISIKQFCPPGVRPDIKIDPTRELKLSVPLNRILKETKTDVAVLRKFTEGNLKRVYVGSTTKSLLEIFDGNLLIIPST